MANDKCPLAQGYVLNPNPFPPGTSFPHPCKSKAPKWGGWVVNILDEEISNSPHMCASQELKVGGANSLAGFSKNNIHECDYITNPTRFWLYQVFGASID
jgi:hypothetical protein